MTKLKSLKRTIIAQIALIPLPLAALLSAPLAGHGMAGTTIVTVLALGVLLLILCRAIILVHELSPPLERAVSIAGRIAAGGKIDETEFELRSDFGDLVKSLRRLYGGFRTVQSDAESYRHGLAKKIEQMAENEASLDEAQRLAQMGNWNWDVSLPTARWSDEIYRILGMAPGECDACWVNFEALVDINEQAALRESLQRLLAAPGSIEIESHITTPQGLYRVLLNHMSSRAGPDGRVARLYGTLQDITERKQNEERLHYLAMYDGLTGLPNRQLFNEQLELAVARAQRAAGTLAVMFIDLDRFKRINDTLGHATGDMLLKEVSSRLGACVRASDYLAHETLDAGLSGGPVARLAGDEFTVTLDALRDPRDAGRVAQRILDEMARPFLLNGEEVVVTTSIGIALYPQDGKQAGMLLKNADAAMYQAKQQGKNTYQFFAGAMNSAAVERLKMESELRHALERDELLLHYQPKIDVHSGRITGVEALMRWQHPERGLVPPGVFIPVAEETGLIVAMGEWVLEEACRQKKAWRDAGLPGIDIAINLASPSFRKPDLVERVAAMLQHYGVPPAELCLEATESILMRDADVTMATLKRLRDLGVKLSVDDFGTGYSSLSYLRRFPINQLKIDRSFVKDITVCADDAAIVTAIVSLAHTLKLEVVAEGVETLEQARRLAEQGCRMMQGFYFARPLPVAQLTPLLADDSANRARTIAPR
jgi:diguanylate cyclase (GGDEF)-like protein